MRCAVNVQGRGRRHAHARRPGAHAARHARRGALRGVKRQQFLAPYKWTPEQKAPWRTNLKTLIDDKWGKKHEFHLRKPEWEWIGAQGEREHRRPRRVPKAGTDHMAIDDDEVPGGAEPLLVQRRPRQQAQRHAAAPPSPARARRAARPTRRCCSRAPTSAAGPTTTSCARRVSFGVNSSDAHGGRRRATLDDWAKTFEGKVGDPRTLNQTVNLEGHASATGSAERNTELAEQRIAAVSTYLRDHGYSERRRPGDPGPQGRGRGARRRGQARPPRRPRRRRRQPADPRRARVRPRLRARRRVRRHAALRRQRQGGRRRRRARRADQGDAGRRRHASARARSPRRPTASCRRATSSGRSTTRPSTPRSARSPPRPSGRSGRRSPSPGPPGRPPAPAPARRSPSPRRPGARAVSEPLLELEFGGGEQGLRVLDDGRLEYRGDVDVDVGADGRACSCGRVPLAWREQWTYTEPELAELRAAIAAADEPPLAGSYGSADGVIHADRHVWRLHIGHRVREVAIEGWPRTRVAPLERLWRLLFALHKPPGRDDGVAGVDGRRAGRAARRRRPGGGPRPRRRGRRASSTPRPPRRRARASAATTARPPGSRSSRSPSAPRARSSTGCRCSTTGARSSCATAGARSRRRWRRSACGRSAPRCAGCGGRRCRSASGPGRAVTRRRARACRPPRARTGRSRRTGSSGRTRATRRRRAS